MKNLIILDTTLTVMAVIFKIAIFYFLIKFLNKNAKIISIVKAIFIYEVGVFISYFIISINFNSLFVAYSTLLIVFLLSFTAYYFVMRYFSLLNFKKSVTSFLIMFIVVAPLVGFIKIQIPKFQNVKIEPEQVNLLIKKQPAILKINGKINGSILEGDFFYALSMLSMRVLPKNVD